MTPKRRKNFERLLKPKHVAVIGGRDAEVAIKECQRAGFTGPIWPVNPRRAEIHGISCFASIADLPEPPDAVFLAVPSDVAIEVLKELNDAGAGGVVCYTAGFSETGDTEKEAALVKATGDMALIGPNCYGMINYVDRVALWPFAHGGSFPGFGAAIITQSGMLSSDLTMSQRSIPLTHMISAGNQSVLQLEDFVNVLCEHDEVRAIGLHIEGLTNVPRFAESALKAVSLGIPIVALKTGSSKIGQKLTVSHTGSLSGSDELYDALFHRYGIIRVSNPSEMLETLKFVTVSGIPKGNSLVGFTCSGGGATMLADHAEKIDLSFPQFECETANKLRALLPDIATVSNPLDYTTPIWGDRERIPPVFKTACSDTVDVAIIVQDYPLPNLDESRPSYFNDTQSFVEATRDGGIPACVCSSLPENLDEDVRDYLVRNGVTPGQGIHEALNAISAAAWYGRRRNNILDSPPGILVNAPSGDIESVELRSLDEVAAKQLLKSFGIPVPEGLLTTQANAMQTVADAHFPVSVKMVSLALPHKTEAGAVKLNLMSPDEVVQAIDQMIDSVTTYNSEAVTDRFLVEHMISDAICELMVSLRFDKQFGAAMTIASGGILVELQRDTKTILLPATHQDILEALGTLRSKKLLDGYRKGPGTDKLRLVTALAELSDDFCNGKIGVEEIEINPLLVLRSDICAIDALIHLR